MTTTGKLVIGGVALTAISAAIYYFYKQSQAAAMDAGAQASAAQAQSSAAAASQSPTSSGAPAAQAAPQSPYEGKVIRADQEPAVYWIIKGVRHGFLSPDALHRSGFDFPQVISVPKAIVMAIPEGSHISGLRGLPTKNILLG